MGTPCSVHVVYGMHENIRNINYKKSQEKAEIVLHFVMS